jgi:hypothetical protein
MVAVVVRSDAEKGFYFTVHDSRGALVAISVCWATKTECSEYARSRMPARIPIHEEIG